MSDEMRFQFSGVEDVLQDFAHLVTEHLSKAIRIDWVNLYSMSPSNKAVFRGELVVISKAEYNKLKITRPDFIEWLKETDAGAKRHKNNNHLTFRHKVPRDQYLPKHVA